MIIRYKKKIYRNEDYKSFFYIFYLDSTKKKLMNSNRSRSRKNDDDMFFMDGYNLISNDEFTNYNNNYKKDS